MATPLDTDTDTYIRGSGPVTVERRRVVRFIVGLGVVVLAGLAVAFTLHAVGERSRTSQLRDHGVVVDATVTGCVGLASGTGITEAGYTCRARFALQGGTHTAVLRGSHDLLLPGRTMRAVTVAANPSLLSTQDAIASSPRSWTTLIVPAVAILATVAAALLWLRLRRSPHLAASTA